jgi:nitrite reductase/ring-hydroxylating ferredoxin subunit
MSSHDCSGDCPIARRVFLKDVSLFTAALVAAGLAPRGAMAASPIRALSREAAEVRYPIPAKDGVQFDDKNEVIVVRNAGKVYAFALSCPHQSTALKLDPAGTGGFYCTKHESRYRPTGEFISGRATRNMDRLVIRRDGNNVVVDVDKWYESDSEPAQWAAAVITL